MKQARAFGCLMVVFIPLVVAATTFRAFGGVARSFLDICPATQIMHADVMGVSPDGDIVTKQGGSLVPADLVFFWLYKSEGEKARLIRFLEERLVGRSIQFAAVARPDRYGRQPVQVAFQNQAGSVSWLQVALIENGFAAFMPYPLQSGRDKVKCLADERVSRLLLAYDNAIRQAASHPMRPFFPIYRSEEAVLWQLEGQFAVVEGNVMAVDQRGKHTYLNFGKNIKTDFTALVAADVILTIENDVKKISNLAGKKIQLRGFIDLNNGPFMRIDHPSQVEFPGQ